MYSVRITKVNRKDKEQVRAFLCTDKAVYNIKPEDYTRCKKRIPFRAIDNLTISTRSNEFVLHVGSSDWRFKSSYRDEIINSLCNAYKKLLHIDLLLNFIDEGLLDMNKLKDITHSKQEDSEGDLSRKDIATPLMITKRRVDIESFDLLKVLGKGAFGKVLQVRLKATGEIYAMKILKKQFILERRQVQHTLAERAILTAFENPFIMNLKFAFQTRQKLFLVMNFYQGGELLFHLSKVKRFSEDQARFIAAELLIALGHLHSLNFMYRDLKLENILMDRNGHICLTDFGLAKQLNTEHPEANTFCGTPQYIAPELLTNKPHGKAVDWWSFGVLLYELVCGVPPFYSENLNEMFEKIKHAPLRFPNGLGVEIRDLITRLLIRDPTRRLGCGVGDIEEIVPHPFFHSIDWEDLYHKRVHPPYRPTVSESEEDISNFDKKAAGSVTESVCKSLKPDLCVPAESRVANNFRGFTFVSSSVTSGLDVVGE